MRGRGGIDGVAATFISVTAIIRSKWAGWKQYPSCLDIGIRVTETSLYEGSLCMR